MKKEGIGNKKMLAIGLIVMLSIAVLSTTTLAYSEKEKENNKGKHKGEKSQAREEKGKSGKDNKNSTTTSQSNTNATVQSSFKSKEYKNEGAKNKTKDAILKPLKNATLGALYTGNMNYTLNANGTAIAISNNSTGTNATITMNLSVWKSNKGIVALKVVNGTITIGDNETHDIHYGKAVLRLKAHKIIITAFVEDVGKPLKLNAKVREDGILPAVASDAALQLDILSPQSKLASKWFLKMDGEMTLS